MHNEPIIYQMKHTTFFTALLSLGLLCGVSSSHAAQPQEKPAYLDASRPIEERVEDALSRMTLEEKVAPCTIEIQLRRSTSPRHSRNLDD